LEGLGLWNFGIFLAIWYFYSIFFLLWAYDVSYGHLGMCYIFPVLVWCTKKKVFRENMYIVALNCAYIKFWFWRIFRKIWTPPCRCYPTRILNGTPSSIAMFEAFVSRKPKIIPHFASYVIDGIKIRHATMLA
jgi:hypothetical protein